MEEKDIFRTAVFGGYQKDDVTDYIRSLENENETIRILANKEKSDLKTQLEKEKAVSEELKTSLAALHDRLSDLEKNRPEETPYSPAPSEAAREDALKYSLEEERRAIREDRQQWADNLAKMQQDMQSLWQNELQQLRSTLETIQSNLKQPACEPQDAAGPVPAAAYPEKEQTEGSHIQPESGQPESTPPSPAVSGPFFSENETPQEEPATPVQEGPQREPRQELQEEPQQELQEEPQLAEYLQKADASISQTQKRVSDLLLKLDDF